jgi:GTP-binding protein
LSAFGHGLDAKPQIVCLNKIDLTDAQENWPAFESALKAEGVESHAISAATQRGTREVLYRALQMLRELPPLEAEPAPAEIPVLRPTGPGFRIRRLPDASWRVEGAPVELAAVRSRLDSEEALMRASSHAEQMGDRRCAKPV